MLSVFIKDHTRRDSVDILISGLSLTGRASTISDWEGGTIEPSCREEQSLLSLQKAVKLLRWEIEAQNGVMKRCVEGDSRYQNDIYIWTCSSEHYAHSNWPVSYPGNTFQIQHVISCSNAKDQYNPSSETHAKSEICNANIRKALVDLNYKYRCHTLTK